NRDERRWAEPDRFDIELDRQRVERIGIAGDYEQLQQAAIYAFGSVKQRVATHLLDLASAQQRPEGRLVAHVSQQDLADAVGSVRAMVARVLRELRVSGAVATSPDHILILDVARLHGEAWRAPVTWVTEGRYQSH